MGGSPSIPAPPPAPPPAPKAEDPAIAESREAYKTVQQAREGRKQTVLTKSNRKGMLLGEEADILRTKLGAG
tara:strand:+ start:266 stop:481 length:216 start_codon:yes stop_codon:yes gene_type:complete